VGSIYEPRWSTSVTITNTTVSPTTNVTSEYYLFTHGVKFTETTMNTLRYVTLLQTTSTNPAMAYPACFLPDLEGDYTLELSTTDGCQPNYSNVTVSVSCGSAPDPKVTASEHAEFNTTVEDQYVSVNASSRDAFQIWDVALSRAVPRRVVLDGRQSVGYTDSKLAFYWAWGPGDERYGTKNAQDNIETPYSPTSAVILMEAKIYYLQLTVHDGCRAKTIDFALDAKCGASASRITTTQSQGLNGRNYYSWNLGFQDQSSSCNGFYWSFENYTETGTFFLGTQSGASSNLPSYALLLVLSLFFIFFH